jgi:predicted 3-demethylubiquinone-9 3-methyltransferase (glyoxalase superfamily)
LKRSHEQWRELLAGLPLEGGKRAETFPESAVGAIHHAPGDYPSGKAGDVLVVEFTIAGIPCIGLNGGPTFPSWSRATTMLVFSLVASFSRTFSIA